jgi:peroxiredoxin
LQSINDQIEALGATVVALTPQSPEKNQAMIDKNDLSFDLLHDIGNDYANQLGLRFTVPLPEQEVYSEFVIDQGGIICSVDVHPDYTRRPEAEKTIEDLKAL